MKVLHVLYSGLGGHGNVFFSLLDADQQHEFTCEALFFGVEDVRSEYIAKCEKAGIKWGFAKKKPGLDLRFNVQMISSIWKTGADIIFLHGSAYILMTKLVILFKNTKCRIVVRETQANHLKTNAQKLFMCFSMLLADKIVFLTKEFKEQVKKTHEFLFNESKTAIVPNGLNLQLYKPGKKAERNYFFIGMQSRLVPIKDHLTLIKAFSLMLTDPPAHFISYTLRIAGDGDCRPKLELYAKEIGIAEHIEFTGTLDQDGLLDFLQSLDLYVHASFGETMSTAIMQAMACRLPVIASDVTGINNMVEDKKNGLLVKTEDSETLAALLRECINKPELREKLASNAASFAELQFSNNRMFRDYRNIFLSNQKA